MEPAIGVQSDRPPVNLLTNQCLMCLRLPCSTTAGLPEDFLWQEPARSPPARDPPPPQAGDKCKDQPLNCRAAAVDKRRSPEEMSGSREGDCQEREDGSSKR